MYDQVADNVDIIYLMDTSIYLSMRMVVRHWISLQGTMKEDSSGYLMKDQRRSEILDASRLSD